jgi:5'-phosphate synthase pdxT subunit
MASTVGVLALQGGFLEHLSLLHKAFAHLKTSYPDKWQHRNLNFIEVRNPVELSRCDALVIPGGESTTIAFIAGQSGLLEPLRQFVKYAVVHCVRSVLRSSSRTLTWSTRVERKPTWGTCAGLILLSEEANATKKGGQELIGGLDVRVQRNHFGRQVESFIADVDLPFLGQGGGSVPFPGVFIRAPIVEELLTSNPSKLANTGEQETAVDSGQGVQVLAVLPNRTRRVQAGRDLDEADDTVSKVNDIVAVRQGNVLGTSFHPELTDDIRMHVWWLDEVFSHHQPSI